MASEIHGIELRTHNGGVETLLHGIQLQTGSVRLAWLRQAGFAVKFARQAVLIDPYLSDSLAEKYRDCEFAHARMMPSPIEPGKVRAIDAVFCTHRHGDHMDPGTLSVLADVNPRCRFIVPRAEAESAAQLGLPKERILTLDAGETMTLAPNIQATAMPSAHETLVVNDRGEHRFLGYILRLGDLTIYHSGDCVPYEGLAERLGREHIDLALLPVNGRDEFRRTRGVSGNMTFDEAKHLCRAAAIPWLVPHHFGMFAFNTADPQEFAHEMCDSDSPRMIVPTIDSWLELRIPAFASFGHHRLVEWGSPTPA